MSNTRFSWWHSIGRRFIIYILLFSSVVTLLGTAVHLYFEYRRDLRSIEANIKQIETGYLASISEGLWSFNERMVRVQLLGILDLPDIRYLEIKREGEAPFAIGEPVRERSVMYHFPLRYSHRGQEIDLGRLKVVVGMDEVYARMWSRVLVIFATQAVKTFFVSTFIFFLFYFLVGRHLGVLADYARSLKLSRLDRPLVLHRGGLSGSDQDELGQVATAINEMRQALLAESEQREKMAAQLLQAQKMEAVGTLAGGVAHDFNNILTPIIGYCELAKMQLSPAEQEKMQVEEILQAARRARDLVQQILTFSRRQEQERVRLELQPIIKENIKFLRSSLPSTIEISQDLAADCGQVLADLTQIQQVILNLCTNAAQAMEEQGGVLEINLRRVEIGDSQQLAGEPLPPGNYACLTVSDTGVGMDGVTRQRIFEPYFTTKEQGKGTGLGLAMVHGIVRGHGGRLAVYSEPGKGTVVRVFLPLAEAAGGTAATPAADTGESAPRGTERILVVDDESRIVEMLTGLLGHLGYRAQGRTDSREALALFRQDPRAFDLVISDQTMPGLTGGELAKALREIRPDLPVIICTGFSTRMSAEQARREGIDGYLMKPFSLDDIAGLVRRVLDGDSAT
ncbi:ATP-binding protein [Desulfurivibrio alkaliphilus]|uniref:histidine kinase n=1 Tax=Desulfurivibrio alkaliphilus (strain DSM 19089 / UNIQEM U267 / AHT2) TaxID=589865 RepID=D6Z5A8_DESAT|nr:ATP-binding protein [Desulfurivibrio alkaliphilus]ADH84765.1 integral membrane sensor hybrid histidine kinase [Desulfurivibrio alkaliphilus AHT 2]